MRLPVSAMIVGFNEERLLAACFKSISFCDDIHYTDLGSTDGSLKIAEQFASHIYHRAPVPSCEMIQTEVVHFTKNDWVLFIDPDERVDVSLADQIFHEFTKIITDNQVGAILVPWQFYFNKVRLKGTLWGGIKHKFLLVNKHRFDFDPVVHYGRKLKNNYTAYWIKPNTAHSNVLHHLWMNDWKVFIRKHRRYLINEGTDKFNLGMRTTLKEVIWAPYYEFKQSFWTMKGYKDGMLGFCLSVFWSWYQSLAIASLYKIQRKNLKLKKSII